MSLIRFELAGFKIGFVRNAKCASTSTLSYILQACGKTIDGFPTHDKFVEQLGEDSYVGLRKPFEDYEKELLECDLRIAVWREPVEKFLSGYAHCMAHNFIRVKNKKSDTFKVYPDDDFRTFIHNYEYLLESNMNVWDHCSPNAMKLGADKSIYTHIYNHKEIDTHFLPLLEAWSGNTIEKQTLRPSNQNLASIPEGRQLEKIVDIMFVDYQTGWCS
jgi:hypothetical protein